MGCGERAHTSQAFKGNLTNLKPKFDSHKHNGSKSVQGTFICTPLQNFYNISKLGTKFQIFHKISKQGAKFQKFHNDFKTWYKISKISKILQ